MQRNVSLSQFYSKKDEILFTKYKGIFVCKRVDFPSISYRIKYIHKIPKIWVKNVKLFLQSCKNRVVVKVEVNYLPMCRQKVPYTVNQAERIIES
jgi:hypothetical protein